MTSTDDERQILIPAITEASARWKEWQRSKSLLGSYPPPEEALRPISDALEKCPSYLAVAGQSLFSGCAGVVLSASSLAAPVLYQADRPGNNAADGAEWVLRTLLMRHATGVFTVAIWGLTIDGEVDLGDGMALVPFAALPVTSMKQRLEERARRPWDNAVWLSQSLFDVPGAAIVRRASNFPYIGDPVKPFKRLMELEIAASRPLALLQALGSGKPVVAASWFEYDDDGLDFNRMENYLTWIMPEIVPRIGSHVAADAVILTGAWNALRALPDGWRQDLLRSMKRFTLSQCRHDLVDQVVDLAIAFEIAMHGSGQGPMSWKVAVRTAQLIGGVLAARQQTRTTMEELFKLRNKGAHGSSMRAAEREHYASTLEQARTLYRTAIAAFFQLRAEPDWKSLELEPRGVG